MTANFSPIIPSLYPFAAGGGGRNEVTRDSSRSHRSQMKRTSSEGKALDYDEPVKETSTTKHENYRSSKAKTHVSRGLM